MEALFGLGAVGIIVMLLIFAVSIWGVVKLFMKGYPLLGVVAIFVPFVFILGFILEPKTQV